jgi:hypothetical protein
VAASTVLPLTVALEARWGDGKSFLLHLVEEGVDEHSRLSRGTLGAMAELLDQQPEEEEEEKAEVVSDAKADSSAKAGERKKEDEDQGDDIAIKNKVNQVEPDAQGAEAGSKKEGGAAKAEEVVQIMPKQQVQPSKPLLARLPACLMYLVYAILALLLLLPSLIAVVLWLCSPCGARIMLKRNSVVARLPVWVEYVLLLQHAIAGGTVDELDAAEPGGAAALITTLGPSFVVVKFNAWTFGSESLWAALIVMVQDEVRRPPAPPPLPPSLRVYCSYCSHHDPCCPIMPVRLL